MGSGGRGVYVSVYGMCVLPCIYCLLADLSQRIRLNLLWSRLRDVSLCCEVVPPQGFLLAFWSTASNRHILATRARYRRRTSQVTRDMFLNLPSNIPYANPPCLATPSSPNPKHRRQLRQISIPLVRRRYFEDTTHKQEGGHK